MGSVPSRYAIDISTSGVRESPPLQYYFHIDIYANFSGRRGYGFAITLLSLRDISPIRGLTPSTTIILIYSLPNRKSNETLSAFEIASSSISVTAR